jgi:hypothetical protein
LLKYLCASVWACDRIHASSSRDCAINILVHGSGYMLVGKCGPGIIYVHPKKKINLAFFLRLKTQEKGCGLRHGDCQDTLEEIVRGLTTTIREILV